jgi:hypothetical protein
LWLIALFESFFTLLFLQKVRMCLVEKEMMRITDANNDIVVKLAKRTDSSVVRPLERIKEAAMKLIATPRLRDAAVDVVKVCNDALEVNSITGSYMYTTMKRRGILNVPGKIDLARVVEALLVSFRAWVTNVETKQGSEKPKSKDTREPVIESRIAVRSSHSVHADIRFREPEGAPAIQTIRQVYKRRVTTALHRAFANHGWTDFRRANKTGSKSYEFFSTTLGAGMTPDDVVHNVLARWRVEVDAIHAHSTAAPSVKERENSWFYMHLAVSSNTAVYCYCIKVPVF